MTLSIANHDASLPVAYRLYLPKEWASDRERRRKVGVPDEISLQDQARDRAGSKSVGRARPDYHAGWC